MPAICSEAKLTANIQDVHTLARRGLGAQRCGRDRADVMYIPTVQTRLDVFVSTMVNSLKEQSKRDLAGHGRWKLSSMAFLAS